MHSILIIVFLPLIAAIVAGFINKSAPSVFAKAITTGALLIAMIGAIVLTHRKRPGGRGQQNITKQVRRNPNEATVMKQPTVGEGVEL